MTDASEDAFKTLATALVKVVAREMKRKGHSPAQVCGALGAVAANVVACSFEHNGGIVDGMMLGALGTGYVEVLKVARGKETN